jgi:hypothetical protein
MTTPQQFKSRKAAHQYLLDKGHPIPYSTFADAVAAGKCPVEADRKTILLSSLIGYIDKYLKPGGSSPQALADRKAKLEVDELEERLIKRRLENRREDAAWMLRTDHEEQVAAILGTAQEMVRQRFDLDGAKILHVSGGDVARLPELVVLLEETIDAAFNDLAGTHEFDVVFTGVGEG